VRPPTSTEQSGLLGFLPPRFTEAKIRRPKQSPAPDIAIKGAPQSLTMLQIRRIAPEQFGRENLGRLADLFSSNFDVVDARSFGKLPEDGKLWGH
jgi:hypothetical protein